ncbi:tail fiber protein, partial [Acinetobacter baumannii]|nr:tail fiber protein [Acinetobacter baumannii]
PQGAAPYPLAQASNLADVENKGLARKNINVFSKEESKANGIPPGAIVCFAMNKAPTGYLKANGAAISRTVYADLFAEIGTMYAEGDGVNTFNIPDARAEFIRALDDGRGIDIGRVIGSKQTQQVLKHKHMGFGEAIDGWIFGNSAEKGHMGTNGGLDYDNYLYFTNDGTAYKGEDPNPAGVVGNENRPRNIAFLACIKY